MNGSDATENSGESCKSRRNPVLHLNYVIGSLSRILRRRMSETLSPLDLTLAQYTALSVLDERGPSSNAEVARLAFITAQSANHILSMMVDRRWIARRPDPTHGKVILLYLTSEGRQILRQCEQAILELGEQMLVGVKTDAAASTRKTLQTFVRNLRG